MVNKPDATPEQEAGAEQEPGRLELDDRGFVTWQWSADEALQADDDLGTAQRLQALRIPGLDLVEDDAPNRERVNTTGILKGYDPYDSGTLNKQMWKKKKDLQELSRWVELRRKLESGNDDGGGEGE